MIRLATGDDVAALEALEARLFGPDAWDDSALRAELVGIGRRFVLAVADEAPGQVVGEVVGYAVSRSVADVVDLHRIAVAPERQRSGVASRLLHDLLAHPGNAERMMLEVSADNLGAAEFYRRHGFTALSVRPHYYRDGSDAVVMSRPIAQADLGSWRMEW